ncbi:choice-of-anchor P family protein [Saccharothrix sp. S26]|uniref:choice-of-anchor P family protein n=1 Tax=Saccharothrix sp. S26 TaxID=2907215 RepID=UPI001F2D0E7A|nr:choice-of-anchor P family protein [Saccharothrix sp. S26]MCE6993384.1 choice-of-anchor P family protein [Saccharothrix sp. S26]
MRVRMTRRAAVAGLVAVAALVVSAAPASAAPGDASAHGAKLALSLLGRDAVSAGPFAAAAADGPTTSTFASVDRPGVLRTGVLDASASRDDKTGGVSSWASTADVRLDLLATVTGGLSAQLAEAECAATQKGVMGKAKLAGLDLGRLGDVDAEPAPNTAIDVDLLGVDIARVVFNEQVRNADGSLTVNAVHVTLIGGVLGSLGSGDLVISSATCGPAGLPIPMASGAGLWIGLGLLALFGVPVGAAALRRRHDLEAV